jgi:hypothetical protein
VPQLSAGPLGRTIMKVSIMKNWIKIFKNNVVFYILIVISIILLLNLSCNQYSDVHYTKYDPLMGYLINSSGQPISGAKINNYFYDSTQSLDNGSYILKQGIPNFYYNDTYVSMDGFELICTHPLYDTTIAKFVDSILYHPADYNHKYYDTLFTAPANNYGNVGGLRHVPTIVMKSKTH